MKTTTASALRLAPIGVCLATLVIAASVAAAPEPEEQAAPVGTIEDLGWLAGTWRGKIGPGTWEAVYTTPSGGEVLSTNKEIRAGKLVSFEFERFFREGDAVRMTPYVKGVKRVAFTLTASDPKARKAVFENPKHDFPQRIVYHRLADDRLVIDVTAGSGAERRGFRLDLRRASLPGSDSKPAGGAK